MEITFEGKRYEIKTNKIEYINLVITSWLNFEYMEEIKEEKCYHSEIAYCNKCSPVVPHFNIDHDKAMDWKGRNTYDSHGKLISEDTYGKAIDETHGAVDVVNLEKYRDADGTRWEMAVIKALLQLQSHVFNK